MARLLASLTASLGGVDKSRVRLPAIAVVMCIGLACDEPSRPPVSDAKPAEPASEPNEPPAAVEPSEDTPAEPPPPVGGPHCDQRETSHTCVDFTDHTGVTEVRCLEGAELQDGPCPTEAKLASCTLASTGVTLHYYDGKTLEAAREICETIDGKLEMD